MKHNIGIILLYSFIFLMLFIGTSSATILKSDMMTYEQNDPNYSTKSGHYLWVYEQHFEIYADSNKHNSKYYSVTLYLSRDRSEYQFRSLKISELTKEILPATRTPIGYSIIYKCNWDAGMMEIWSEQPDGLNSQKITEYKLDDISNPRLGIIEANKFANEIFAIVPELCTINSIDEKAEVLMEPVNYNFLVLKEIIIIDNGKKIMKIAGLSDPFIGFNIDTIQDKAHDNVDNCKSVLNLLWTYYTNIDQLATLKG